MSDIDRSPVSAIPAEYLDAFQKGTMRYTYKGVNCLKNPFDIALWKPTFFLWILNQEQDLRTIAFSSS